MLRADQRCPYSNAGPAGNIVVVLSVDGHPFLRVRAALTAKGTQDSLHQLVLGLRMARRLAEVARKVGVSEATVSRVLNGKPGVSEPTRQAVLTALDVLGYERPTKLRGERARLVGLVLPELQNPIFPAFAEVVGGALAQQGYTPVLCTQTAGGVSRGGLRRAAAPAAGVRRRVRRRPVCAARRAARALPPARRAQAADRPGQRRRSTGCGFPRVSCDDAVAVEQAMGHLALARPYADRLVLGPADHVPSEPQARGGRAVAERAGSRAATTTRSCTRSTRSRRPRRPRPGCSRPASRHRLCQRPDGARCDPRRPPAPG